MDETVKGLSKQVIGGWRRRPVYLGEARNGSGWPGQRMVALTWHPRAVVGHFEAWQ